MDPQQNSNIPNMNNVPNMNNAPTPSGSSVGPVIGIIIILVVIILAGLYFWGQKDMDTEIEETNTTASTESITVQSQSDETDSIENDLNNTEIESLDAELNAS